MSDMRVCHNGGMETSRTINALGLRTLNIPTPGGPTLRECLDRQVALWVCTGCREPVTLAPGEEPCCGQGATRVPLPSTLPPR
jgi:hypothetical protein